MSTLGLSSCVISSLCVPDEEFQRINPTTQVALFALCLGQCSSQRNITWNVYRGSMNTTSNVTQWTLFNQMNVWRDLWFFGTVFHSINLRFHFSLFKGRTRTISPVPRHCFWPIHEFICGNSKWFIHFFPKAVQVPFIFWLTNLLKMALVQSIH